MSKVPTAAEQIAELGKSLGERIGQIEKGLEAIAQPLHQPGMTPADLFAKLAQQASQGGQDQAGSGLIVAPDGTLKSITPRKLYKGVGMGAFLKDLLAVSAQPVSAQAEERMAKHGSKLVSKAALAEGAGVTGGYTVPPQFVAQLLALAAEQALVRPLATVIPMTARNVLIPALDHTGGASGASPYLGGVVATWTEEAATRTESEPTFKQIELVAHELSLYTLASNTLLADSAIALDALLSALFSMAIAWYEDYAFLRGDGVGKPLGVLNAPCLISTTRTTSSRFKLADAANMLSKLLPGSHNTACWLINPSVIPDLVQMVDGGNNVVWIPNFGGAAPGMGGAAMKMPMMLFGLPIFFTEKLPALGTVGDVVLADLSKYLIGDRMELSIEVSNQVKFLQNQTAWRVVARVDGQPWLTNYLTLADGSTTVGPMIAVAT